MSLASNLKRIRKDNNLSQEQLAEKINVSRQAVSKWESGLAYPEMEKMVTICKMFNLNIDDLINGDVRELNDSKRAKNNINKYIEDFLEFVTKTIDMFSSMSFKTKFKCVIEQLIVSFVLAIIFVIVDSICLSLIQDILVFFPSKVYYVIYSIIEDVIILLSLILGILLVLHIFRVRYLDYYVIDLVEDLDLDKEKHEDKKVYLEKKQERVIIRDPKNSGYRFISLLFRCCLFFIKVFVFIFSSMFCISLICLFFALVLLFMFVKTGSTFIGALLVIVALIIINLIILDILYNFIVNKSSRKNILANLFVLSLALLGIGGGIFCVGITKFNFTTNYDEISDFKIIPFNDDLIIDSYYDVNYIESKDNDIRIVYRHSKYYDLSIDKYNNYIHFNVYSSYNNVGDMLRRYISDINDKKIVDYSYFEIDIYTNSENIEKLKENSY